MIAGLAVQPITELPSDVGVLIDRSLAEGHNLVGRLVQDWRDGVNRFDRPGEVVLEARLGNRLVALGGLNRDPYIEDPAVGRIRHVYVSPDARGVGVGSQLVMALVEHARAGFHRVRLRAGPQRAAGFYLALGFSETPDEPDSTHEVRFR